MAKEKRAGWWKVFRHQKPVVEAVSDADAGLAFKAAMQYFETGAIPGELSVGAHIVLSVLLPGIDESVEDYEKSVENGRRGAQKRWDSPPNAPMEEVAETETEADAEADAEEETERENSSPSEPLRGRRLPHAGHAGGGEKASSRSPGRRPVYAHDAMPYKAAAYLAEAIRENYPAMKPPDEARLQDWADHIRRLNEKDGYDWPLINSVMLFATTDPFWQKNILSGQSFREKFPQLLTRSGAAG